MPTYAATQKGYGNLWDKAAIDPAKRAQAKAIARDIIAKRPQLDVVQNGTDVPWFWSGITWVRESNLKPNTYLGNGQPITQKTTIVPVGRGPFPSFAAGAVDAIQLHNLDDVKKWSVERCLYEWERWNGFGYFGKGNSPYLWSWSALYSGGKFTRDHFYDPNFKDPQPGCAALLKALIEVEPSVATYLAAQGREPEPPKDVIKQAKKDGGKKARKVGKVASAGAGGSVAGHTVGAGDWLGYAVPALLLIAFVAFAIAKFKSNKQAALVAQKWGQ